MTGSSATAPGKIVLCGEYAVLHDAPAIAAALNRRARVSVEWSEEPGISVHAPGYSTEGIRYELSPGGALQRQGSAAENTDFALFETLWNACRPAVDRGLAITLDTSQFLDAVSGQKLGLGSSAALSVALVAALRPDIDEHQVAALAGSAHHEYQQGGSGIDIACSTYGGIIEYRRAAGAPACVALPQDMHFAVLWSGTSSSTVSKIRSLETSLQQPQRHATLHGLIQQADLLAASWRRGDSQQVFLQFSDYISALRAFDDDQQLGVFAGGHAALTDAAMRDGLQYKPCGAGGGDVGVAIALDPKALLRFVTHAASLGFAQLDLALGDGGLRRDGEQRDG